MCDTDDLFSVFDDGPSKKRRSAGVAIKKENDPQKYDVYFCLNLGPRSIP